MALRSADQTPRRLVVAGMSSPRQLSPYQSCRIAPPRRRGRIGAIFSIVLRNGEAEGSCLVPSRPGAPCVKFSTSSGCTEATPVGNEAPELDRKFVWAIILPIRPALGHGEGRRRLRTSRASVLMTLAFTMDPGFVH